MAKGHSLLAGLVATLLDVKAWESLPMPTERERDCKPNRRAPCAVKGCAAGRGAESLTQSGGIRKDIPGSSDLPNGASLGDKSMSEKREVLEGV
jgi:hypothetical protein